METILAIGAHPDDIEIDCAGTIAREIQAKNRVFFLVLTFGEKGGNPETRKKEALESAETLGAKEVLFEGLRDGRLGFEENLVERIISIVQDIKPKRIYSHCERDRSPDHAAVGRAAILASKNVRELFAFKGSPEWNSFQPNYFVSIAEFLKLKERALKAFESQNSKDKFGLDYVKANAIFYGRLSKCGIRHAEAFEVVRMVK